MRTSTCAGLWTNNACNQSNERKGKERRLDVLGKELVTGHEYLHAGDRRDTGVLEDIICDNTKN